MWMDNLYCTGNETELSHCPFDGWLKHDCNTNEAAGVVCRLTQMHQQPSVSHSATTTSTSEVTAEIASQLPPPASASSSSPFPPQQDSTAPNDGDAYETTSRQAAVELWNSDANQVMNTVDGDLQAFQPPLMESVKNTKIRVSFVNRPTWLYIYWDKLCCAGENTQRSSFEEREKL